MEEVNNKKVLMNLPLAIKTMIYDGTYCLYRLANKTANGAPYLLEFSKDLTYYVSENGDLLESAGSLDSIEVNEVIKLQEPAYGTGIKVNIA